MHIESGDVVFIKRRVRWVNDPGNPDLVSVPGEDFTYGHVEVGDVTDSDRRGRDGQPMVTRYLDFSGFTAKGLETAGARVYRSRQSAADRQRVAQCAAALCVTNAEYGEYRAVTSVLRTHWYATSNRHRGLVRKYWPRLVQYANDERQDPIAKKVFCSELVVASCQLGAMIAVTPGWDDPNDDTDARFTAAQKHPLWLETRAKATTPNDLEQLLRKSEHWDYLGAFKHDASAAAETTARLRSVIHRAVAHYNDRFTLGGLFKSTSNETSATLPSLVAIANDDTADAAVLLFAIVKALGVFPKMNRRMKPHASHQVMPLAKNSRLYRCLLLAASQGCAQDLELDASEIARIRER